MPAEVVIHIIFVPVVLPQLGVLGVLGGRVPVVLRELLKFIILLVDLVVGLALLGWFIFLRGSEGVGNRCAASMSVGARASVFTPLQTAGFFASVFAASALGLSLMLVLCFSPLVRLVGPDIAFWLGSGRSSEQMV